MSPGGQSHLWLRTADVDYNPRIREHGAVRGELDCKALQMVASSYCLWREYTCMYYVLQLFVDSYCGEQPQMYFKLLLNSK